jgi:hypothetical protein
MAQTQTADRIDATYRANHYPDAAPAGAIATALDGRKLIDPTISQKVDPICRRCEEKNRKRRMAGVDIEDAQLEHGDKVTLYAVYTDDGLTRRHWQITAVDHTHHPQIDFEDCIKAGTALVRARATIHQTPERFHVVDVDITHRSKTAAGPDQSVVDQRQKQHIDDSDHHPDGMTVIDPEDPPASWPQVDREWLDQLISDHGPLLIQTYGADATPAAPDSPVEPRGTDR